MTLTFSCLLRPHKEYDRRFGTPYLGLPMVAQRNEHRHGGDDLVDRDAAVGGDRSG